MCVCIFFFFTFLGPHLQHVEVPRLGIEKKLQLLAYATATATRNPSAIFVRAHPNARSLTHWVRPGIKPTSSWILVRWTQFLLSRDGNSSSFLFILFFFLGLHLQHMEVSGLEVELELQLQAYSTAMAMSGPSCICNLGLNLWQCWILNPLSKAGDWTCILRDNVGSLLTHWATMGTPRFEILYIILFLRPQIVSIS